MKNIIFCLLLPFCICACSSSKNLVKLTNDRIIDTRLVGTWTGEEKDQQIKGLTKKWVMTRNDKGVFKLDFTMIVEGKENKTVEEGEWWIENGVFHEYHYESDKTDTYKYSMLNDKQVKFKSINLALPFAVDTYEFTDTKIK